MPRLPIPGADQGEWGKILNEYLERSHTTDGTLKAGSVGATQIQDNSIPASKLDPAVQSAIDTAASGVAPDASASTKGVVRLSGDLTGSALNPLIAPGAVTGGGGGSIATGTITDANIHASATISKSKLAPLGITDSDVSSSASIAQSKINGLVTDLANKAATSHTHAISSVTGLQTNLNTLASDIADKASTASLTTGLASKANTTHSHTATDITDLDGHVTNLIGNKLVPGTNILINYDGVSGETTISSSAAGGGGTGSTTVDTVAGKVGDVVLVAGDITGGTFTTARIPDLDANKITTGTLGIARLPLGTTGSSVAVGNHTHAATDITSGVLDATRVPNLAASKITSGTFDVARIPTGTTGTTVALGDHTHSNYAATAHTHDDRYYTETEVDAALATKLNSGEKGTTNGVATLGSDGKIPASQLPAIAINETFTVANQAAMLALTAQRGDMAIRTDTGRTYVLASDSPSTLADWKEILAAGATSPVTSVAGRTGAVTLTKSDVGLANVDNTSDTNKPISSAAQTALNARLVWRGAFASSTVYAVNDIVSANGATYRCQTAHTAGAGAPATNGDPTYWERIGTIAASGATVYANALTTYRVFKEAGGNWPGGTTSTWTRPTDSDTVSFELVGPDPSPAIVTSGTGGMRAGLDIRSRTA